ncbi:MAG: type I pullulanase [Saprospiraceae bacterium]
MQKTILFSTILSICLLMACQETPPPVYQSFDEYPVYEGTDLGLTYTSKKSIFKLYAPPAAKVVLRFYEKGDEGQATEEIAMKRTENGVWEASINKNLEGQYYTFQTLINEKWGEEVPDPYVKAVGVNGKRGHIIDFTKTNPIGWTQDKKPVLKNPTDIILYELHVRDLSMHENSGIQNKGKFLGLTEKGTKSRDGAATGIDHIKDLGVTHVHLLPSYDYMSIDESKLEENNFNWGYDPQNYNVPEGSYSTNPYDGAVRVKEFKELVKTLHDNGLRVILDVVYNHTGVSEESNFNQLLPGYYYRQNNDGGFSNASGCGNETASDRPMMRKFIIESVKHWVNEYHLDGFRFDLMGIHDIETMNQISAALHEIDPSIFIYGEGWTAGDSPLLEPNRALKKHTPQMKGVAAFSDDIRDGLKGSVFDAPDRGFASGKPYMEESIKFGVVASTQHPQINYEKVNYSNEPWAAQPSQAISYVSCHDNHTLWDRLINSQPNASESERINMAILANTVVLTSQGIPFLHAGVEMLRTKNGEENSYKSPDAINKLDWSRKTKYPQVFETYQKLIQLRKNHPAFRMPTTKMIQQHLKFIDFPEGSLLVGYTISDNANGDEWKDILVVFNGNQVDKPIDLPTGNWTMVLRGDEIDEASKIQVTNQVKIPASSAMIFYKN